MTLPYIAGFLIGSVVEGRCGIAAPSRLLSKVGPSPTPGASPPGRFGSGRRHGEKIGGPSSGRRFFLNPFFFGSPGDPPPPLPPRVLKSSQAPSPVPPTGVRWHGTQRDPPPWGCGTFRWFLWPMVRRWMWGPPIGPGARTLGCNSNNPCVCRCIPQPPPPADQWDDVSCSKNALRFLTTKMK